MALPDDATLKLMTSLSNYYGRCLELVAVIHDPETSSRTRHLAQRVLSRGALVVEDILTDLAALPELNE